MLFLSQVLWKADRNSNGKTLPLLHSHLNLLLLLLLLPAFSHQHKKRSRRNLTTVQRYQHQVIPDNNYFYQLQNPVAETPSSQQPLSSVSLFGPPLPLPTGVCCIVAGKIFTFKFLSCIHVADSESKTVVLKAEKYCIASKA